MVEECTGCLGCIDICKVGALDVETMEDGFIYPKIDKDNGRITEPHGWASKRSVLWP